MIFKNRNWFLFVITASLEFYFASGNLHAIDAVSPFSEPGKTISDSISITKSTLDSSTIHTKLKFNSDRRFYPVNSYFRDEYRIIRDMRRLVYMFDHRINGYESMDELFKICQSLPEGVQTKMICTAFAGGIVNFLSDMTNKQLRKRKVNFFQWKLEKVILQTHFKFFYIDVYGGLSAKGIAFRVPKLRLYYYRYSTQYYNSDSFTFWLTPYLGLNYSQWNQSRIMMPLLVTPIGYITFGYDRTFKRLISTFELLKSNAIVIRLVHVNYFEQVKYNYMLSEVRVRL